MPKFALSLIGMRRPEATRQCLARMIQFAEGCHFFVTSNGCEATGNMFLGMSVGRSDITVTVNPENIGFQIPHARQFAAAAKMGCEYCLIANDDISVPERFLQALAYPMDMDQRVAITGPEGNCGWLNDDFHGHGGSGSGMPEYIEMSCGMIRIAAIRRLRTSLWCPGLRWAYGEDSSQSLFVREKGLKIQTVPIHVSHVQNATVAAHPDIKRICMEAQEANHRVNRERFGYYLARRSFQFPIILRRAHALGDVILTTPLIRALKKTLPLCPIHVETDFPEVFRGNPNVASAQKSQPHSPHELRINLDMAYEQAKNTHIVHAYEWTARQQLPGLEPVELSTEMFPSEMDLGWAAGVIQEEGGKPLAVLATDQTHWTGRNLPHERFFEVAEMLRDRGFACVTVGKSKPPFERPLARNLCGLTSVMQLAALCSKARLFFGTCSGPLHVAQAVGCPTIGCFGVTRSRFILTHRGPAIGIDGEGSDAGERHRREHSDFVPGSGEAIKSITTEQIERAINLITA